MSLTDRIKGLFMRITHPVVRNKDFPLFWTAFSGIAGFLLELPRHARSIMDEGVLSASAMHYHLTMGLIIDGSRYASRLLRKRALRKAGMIEKVYSPEYIEALGETIGMEKGIPGKLTGYRASLFESQGTSPLAGGHLAKVKFIYESGKDAEVIIKSTRKAYSRNGFKASKVLSSLFDFIPMAYSAGSFMASPYTLICDEKGKRITTLLGSYDKDGKLLRREPSVSELVDGISLDGLIRCGSPVCDPASKLPVDSIDRVFDSLFRVYSLNPAEHGIARQPQDGSAPASAEIILPEFESSKRIFGIMETRGGEKGKAFFGKYMPLREGEFEGIPLSLIHGDLHQGNILVSDKDKKAYIIDWDNCQFGIPYQDFMLLSMFTDMDRSPCFEAAREKFKRRQAGIMPRANERHMKLIEFETYLMWSYRFASDSLDKEKMRPEFMPNMLSSSRYLLEKAKSALAEYSAMSGRRGLAQIFDEYARDDAILGRVSREAYNPNASCAYAYATRNGELGTALNKILNENLEKDIQHAEMVMLNQSATHGAKIAMAGLVAAAAGSYAYVNFSSEGAGELSAFPILYVGGAALLLPYFLYNMAQKRFFKGSK